MKIFNFKRNEKQINCLKNLNDFKNLDKDEQERIISIYKNELSNLQKLNKNSTNSSTYKMGKNMPKDFAFDVYETFAKISLANIAITGLFFAMDGMTKQNLNYYLDIFGLSEIMLLCAATIIATASIVIKHNYKKILNSVKKAIKLAETISNLESSHNEKIASETSTNNLEI